MYRFMHLSLDSESMSALGKVKQHANVLFHDPIGSVF